MPVTQGNRNGANTFLDTQGLAMGPDKVLFGQVVLASCKVLNTSMPSASPAGYWYRIASPPWHNRYYAVSNTFTNGDDLGDPSGSTPVDPAVPDC
ncbi:hypothetical protein SK854_45870 [Lentzea sp. BCCO 10_0061]|uniref:Uncharacterized protein n=1 Tax=Lentzea sokolovensis TaxID=3095429 RepID=A0ABU4VCT2_9PSEU|nr:hypothetical protein [Lentzea sp. BCCO 10_0061]MDX8149519.1 hypothetical protein [Lentzea sp. BCCO 10_0061]